MKFLYYPLSPWNVSQAFGEDRVCLRNVGSTVEYRVKKTEDACPAGFRRLYGSMKGHNGIDVGRFPSGKSRKGAPIYAAANGKVTQAVVKDTGFGVYIEQLCPVGTDTFVKLRYAHMTELLHRPGDNLTIGDIVGYVGNTGSSTGPHLHFDMKWCDQDGNTLNHDNGYWGAVDPTPYFNGNTAQFVHLIKRFRLWSLFWKYLTR